jgi:lipopolysaccharide/colanic/teichoic acid biosynthesis glycosyltransferase
VGARMLVRLFVQKRRGSQGRQVAGTPGVTEHLLIVGVSDETELYLRSIAEFASTKFVVSGILTSESSLRGRSLRALKVLGEPQNIQQVVSELDVHGVTVSRVVVTKPFAHFSKEEQHALQTLELSSTIRIDWLTENLGFDGESMSAASEQLMRTPETKDAASPPGLTEAESVKIGKYHRLKRVIDGAVAACILVVLAPISGITSVLVAIDVGFPILFWQQRPGKHGYPFKVFKFRTMGAAHDDNGYRIPDELRSSSVGRFLRHIWLDELPQLYNIMVGEMSFVGPRPLLPVDQPLWQASRLSVRPGLTGWAQINGGRDLSSEEKAAFDIWYIENASLGLDLEILFATARILALGGQLNAAPLPKVEAEKTLADKVEANPVAVGNPR